ncbi:hypothetical protein [Streptococcus sp. zg-JUN1979]|uniref:hypothetical protein n=1 Tax=Streptococcus sp. zg-JUN1979 TaxID=3391450 RepID=UPI0039AFA3B1
MRFDYRSRRLSKKYLLEVWTQLYFSHPKSLILYHRFKVKKGKIRKIGWLDRRKFQLQNISIEELDMVREMLSSFDINQLEELDYFIQMSVVDSDGMESVKFARKYFWNGLILSIVPLFFTFFEIEKTVISVNGDIIYLIIQIMGFVWFLLYAGFELFLDYSTYKKRTSVNSILPKLIKDILKEKQENC